MGMPIISHLHGPHPIPVINNSQSEQWWPTEDKKAL